ncbi:fimbrial biogenesis chaperone [Enterobacter asburiae]|uniref:fimbrial biogenesis chaperone n=1 Tax=Enterobacter asburiae TaxID=61645 RepID=UPI00163C3275|nr:molecular chaperone [Enterobacter asburiae]
MGVLMLLAALSGLWVNGYAGQGNSSYPGFGLSLSRVVVSVDDPQSARIYAVNNSENVYLVQSRVWLADGASGFPVADKPGSPRIPAPFMVTPPLRRIEKNGVLPLRIIPLKQAAALPQDRESLFFLSAKAIPSQPSDPDAPKAKDVGERGATLSLALQSYIKLFYRPTGLSSHAIFDGGVADKLTFSLDGGRLKVTNPTPYYITFGLLTVAGKPVDADSRRAMVPPAGSYGYPLPAGVSGGEVTWQVIDEFGLMTDMRRQPLS